MRDAVDKTGLLHGVEKLTTAQAAELGHFEMLKHMHLRGRLQHKAALCAAAATGGQLERLHWLRANGCPWNEDTCKCAAMNGQLTVLQRARANGCPWEKYVQLCGKTRAARGAEVGARERLPVG